jgi:N-acetylneuraminate synthase
MREMKIADREIGPNTRPLLIAEMSGNHNQSLHRALAIVDAAADAGADAIKLQTYTADTMTLDTKREGFVITDTTSLWSGRALYDLYAEAHTPWDWHGPIMARAAERGLLCFSTPFDETSVAFLETLGVPAYKIASFEITDLPLIRRVAGTGRPMILSTGMATLGEIDEAVMAARSAGATDLVLLKCTSSYPASPENTNLRSIPVLRETFRCEVGLSDHTMGSGAAVAAVALGAAVIEKHFTLARADGGVDAAFSLEPDEFRALRTETERAWLAMGSVRFGPTKSEQGSLIFRRSLYVSKASEAGAIVDDTNIRIVRPGYGLPPKYRDQVLGRRFRIPVEPGTPVSWDLLA